jgi:hypothetical protein
VYTICFSKEGVGNRRFQHSGFDECIDNGLMHRRGKKVQARNASAEIFDEGSGISPE